MPVALLGRRRSNGKDLSDESGENTHAAGEE